MPLARSISPFKVSGRLPQPLNGSVPFQVACPDTAEIRLFAVQSPRFWVSGQLDFESAVTSILSQRICRNISCALGKWSLHSRWNFISTFTELLVHVTAARRLSSMATNADQWKWRQIRFPRCRFWQQRAENWSESKRDAVGGGRGSNSPQFFRARCCFPKRRSKWIMCYPALFSPFISFCVFWCLSTASPKNQAVWRRGVPPDSGTLGTAADVRPQGKLAELVPVRREGWERWGERVGWGVKRRGGMESGQVRDCSSRAFPEGVKE